MFDPRRSPKFRSKLFATVRFPQSFYPLRSCPEPLDPFPGRPSLGTATLNSATSISSAISHTDTPISTRAARLYHYARIICGSPATGTNISDSGAMREGSSHLFYSQGSPNTNLPAAVDIGDGVVIEAGLAWSQSTIQNTLPPGCPGDSRIRIRSKASRGTKCSNHGSLHRETVGSDAQIVKTAHMVDWL